MFKCKPVAPIYWGMKITADGGGNGTSTSVTLEDGRTAVITWAGAWNQSKKDGTTDIYADADVAANDFVIWAAYDSTGNAIHTPVYQLVLAENLDTDYLIIG